MPPRFPTLALFVCGTAGIAAARALLEAPPDVAGLALALRGDVVVYYTVRRPPASPPELIPPAPPPLPPPVPPRRLALCLTLALRGNVCAEHTGLPLFHPPQTQPITPTPHPPHPLNTPSHPQAPNDASFLYRAAFERWAAAGPVRVVTSTRGFGDAFDGDDLLMYDPPTTAAIILSEPDAHHQPTY